MTLPPLLYAAAIAVVLPSLVGSFMYRRLPPDLRPLTVLFGVHAAITVAQFALAFQRINNVWTTHVYNVIEVLLLLSIFASWTASRRAKLSLWGIMVLYAVFWILAKALFERFDTSPVFTPTVSRIILLAGSVHILFLVATNQEQILVRQPRFWFASGFLLAYAGSLMYYGFRSIFSGLPLDEIIRLWSIHWMVTILSNVFFIAGFACVPSARNTGGQLELAP